MEYPEHDKLRHLNYKTEILNDFFESLPSSYGLANFSDGQPYFISRGERDKLFADFIGIDMDKIEEEKRAMLKELRLGY